MKQRRLQRVLKEHSREGVLFLKNRKLFKSDEANGLYVVFEEFRDRNARHRTSVEQSVSSYNENNRINLCLVNFPIVYPLKIKKLSINGSRDMKQELSSKK